MPDHTSKQIIDPDDRFLRHDILNCRTCGGGEVVFCFDPNTYINQEIHPQQTLIPVPALSVGVVKIK